MNPDRFLPARLRVRGLNDLATERLANRAILFAARLLGVAAGTHLSEFRGPLSGSMPPPAATMRTVALTAAEPLKGAVAVVRSRHVPGCNGVQASWVMASNRLVLSPVTVKFWPLMSTGKANVVFSSGLEAPMTDTLTIPAHIENGSLHLDAPLPSGIVSVEIKVRVGDRAPSSGRRKTVGEFVRALPTGNRTREEIESQVREERESWPE